MRRTMRPLWIALTLLAAATSAAADSPWGKDYLPNVTVYDQDSKPLKFYDDVIRDKIVVVSFIYTSCRNICPLITSRLADVKDRLGPLDGTNIHFVSISIDPIPDTPDKLKAMAEAFRTGDRWTFLTGTPDDIDQIRYKLGERSKVKTEHRNEVLLGNDRTGEWAHDSVFGDLDVLANTIRSMDPRWREQRHLVAATTADHVVTNDVGRPGESMFIKACASCHTVGHGDKVGPDLSGVIGRQGKEWVRSYLMSPDKVRAEHDAHAADLMARFPAVRMPTLGIAESDATDLISYIEGRTTERAELPAR